MSVGKPRGPVALSLAVALLWVRLCVFLLRVALQLVVLALLAGARRYRGP